MKKIVLAILLIIIPPNIFALSTSADCGILMDMESKRIIYGNDIHKQRSVASISKIMTAVLAIESGKMNDIVTVGSEIEKSYGSGIYIQQGEEITLRDLVYGLMLRSGNDASYIIAKYVGGNNFVEMMNEKAKEIGMRNTIFNNPNGLEDNGGNYSTAYDMALLTSYAMNLEEYKKIVSTRIHRLTTNKNTYLWTNKNKLLFMYDYATGGKTGYTEKAKRTLVSTASYNDLNLVAVTLNDGNDFNDHLNLYKEAFDNYRKIGILKKGILNIYDEIYYGNYYLMLNDNFTYPITTNEEVSIKFELNDTPSSGVVGSAKVLINGEVIHTQNIEAKEIKKHAASLMEWFRKIW